MRNFAARACFALAALGAAAASTLHAAAFDGAMAKAASLDDFLLGAIKALWAGQSATLYIAAAALFLAAARLSRAALAIVAAALLIAGAGAIYAFIGGFAPAHLLAVCAVLALAGLALRRNAA